MSTSHMLVLLSVLESISLDRNHSLEDDDVNKLVDLCVKEITRNDSQKQVQGVASNILISLGCKHCNHVRYYFHFLLNAIKEQIIIFLIFTLYKLLSAVFFNLVMKNS